MRLLVFSRQSLLLLCVSVSVLAAPNRTPSPIVYDITALTPADSTFIRLIGGKSVPLPSIRYDKIFFVDDFPRANWEHPARMVFNKGGQTVLEIPVRLPPMGLTSRLTLGPPLEHTSPSFKISELDRKYWVKNPSAYYAVLLSGLGDERHWNDFAFLYRVLTKVYGYLPSNIMVADSNFKTTAPDLDGDGQNDIVYGSSMSDVRAVMTSLAEKLNRGDQLLLVVNDHGSIKDGESTLILADGEMKASEFAQILKALPVERLLLIFEQCFSGGFVRPTVGPTRVSIAASTDREISWASEDGQFDEFLYLMTSAFARQKHDGTPVNADTNSDGKISAREAFSYTVTNDRTWESPLMEAHVNSGLAFSLGVQ